MTNKDIIFKTIKDADAAKFNGIFCLFAWEGTGELAFATYAESYFDSASALYEKIKQSNGDYRIIDGLGLAMCFCYRHYVELELKYLHIKYGVKTEDEYKSLLGIGHSLVEIWKKAKPTIEYLHKRIGSSVNLDVIEHYICAVHDFDASSMSMRYPVTRRGERTKPRTRLDLKHLVDRMTELKQAFDKLDDEIDHQMLVDVDKARIQSFLEKYIELRPRVVLFLTELQDIGKQDSKKLCVCKCKKTSWVESLFSHDNECTKTIAIFSKYSDDEQILFDTLYYTGRNVYSEDLHLPKSQSGAKKDITKSCVLNMERDNLEFGKPKNDSVQLQDKMASRIIQFIKISMQHLDYNE